MDTNKMRILICVCVFTVITVFITYSKVRVGSQKFLGKLMAVNRPITKEDRFSTTTMPTNETQKQDKSRENKETFYENRRNVVMQGCTKLNRTVTNSLKFSRIEIDAMHHIYYCPIPKVGSTFWRRTLTVLASNGRLKSPYEITLKGVRKQSWKTLSEHSVKSLEKDGDSFLFVRDPYARLFSGYENKIYQPNCKFWKSVGSKIVQTVRPTPLIPHSRYGYDVTFPEFIKYVIHTREHNKTLNGHFKPMNKLCDPCRTHYKYIGHLETFADDADYFISNWRRKFNDVTLNFADMYKEAGMDTARGHLRFLFEAKNILPTIQFPFINLILRTWRDFQIRGYISKHTEFPYKGDVSNVTQDEILAYIADAVALPQNRSSVKLQRNEALIQAYRQVPLEDMERLRQFVLTDCLLFGYDDRPPKLFERKHVTTDEFLYLDGLSKTPYH